MIGRRLAIAGGVLVLLAVAACAPTPTWRLLQPPELANPAYPRGYQVLKDAAQTEGHSVGAFESETACEAARQQRTDDAIDRARELYGAEAKYDLAVRRAVHARCVAGR